MTPTDQARKDANNDKAARNLTNAPAKVREDYNAAYDAEKKKRGW